MDMVNICLSFNMKKIILGIFSILLACTTNLQAQDKGFTGGVTTRLSGYDSEFKFMNLSLDIGYYIVDRLSISMHVEPAISLFNVDDTKTYSFKNAFGSGLNYEVLTFSGGALDIRGSFGSSIKSSDWKYTYYDAGIYCNLGQRECKPTFGLGVRYFDSRNDHYYNYCRVFFSVGFKFN